MNAQRLMKQSSCKSGFRLKCHQFIRLSMHSISGAFETEPLSSNGRLLQQDACTPIRVRFARRLVERADFLQIYTSTSQWQEIPNYPKYLNSSTYMVDDA